MKNRDLTMCIIIVAVIALFICTVICVCYADCMTANAATMVSGAISAAATVILGFIAVWQNKRYKTLSDENAKEIKKLTLTPECYLAEIETRKPPTIPCKTMIPDLTKGKYYYLIFSSLNQPMLNVTIKAIRFSDKQGEFLSSYSNQIKQFLTNIQTLAIFENYTKFTFEILIPAEYDNLDISCEVILEYKNIYNAPIRKVVSFNRSKDSVGIKNVVAMQAKLL